MSFAPTGHISYQLNPGQSQHHQQSQQSSGVMQTLHAKTVRRWGGSDSKVVGVGALLTSATSCSHLTSLVISTDTSNKGALFPPPSVCSKHDQPWQLLNFCSRMKDHTHCRGRQCAHQCQSFPSLACSMQSHLASYLCHIYDLVCLVRLIVYDVARCHLAPAHDDAELR